MHLFIWIVTALLLALWSLLAYGAYAVLALATGVNGLPADWFERLARLPGAAWLDLWLPGWREAVVWSAQMLGAVLGWLGDAAPVLVWVVWGVGALMLVLIAALCSGLVALARKAAPSPPATPPTPPTHAPG